MSRSRRSVLGLGLGVTAWAGLTLGGCARSRGARVFAAASLAASFEALARELLPDLRCEFNFAGSQVLANQLVEGAPADVFASADAVQMERAQASGRLEAAKPFATNELVIAVADGARTRIVRPEDLGSEGLKIVLAAPEVPAGRYARDALDRAGLADAVAGQVVSEEDAVSGVVTKLVTGEADAGLVYRTDALAHPEALTVVELPPSARVSATYHVAPLADAREPGRRFIAELSSEAGVELLARFGFGRPT